MIIGLGFVRTDPNTYRHKSKMYKIELELTPGIPEGEVVLYKVNWGKYAHPFITRMGPVDEFIKFAAVMCSLKYKKKSE